MVVRVRIAKGFPRLMGRRNRAGYSFVTHEDAYIEPTKAELEAFQADPRLEVEQVDEAPEGAVVQRNGLNVEGSAPAEEESQPSLSPKSKRSDLEARATELGIEDPSQNTYENKESLYAAIVEAEEAAGEEDLEDEDEESEE